ncbi:MAG: aldolase/citrate lyase family protein [Halobacteriales archaeon]|nr:aldolase/citrate lyase family protein [Halobacteriales archaeon]
MFSDTEFPVGAWVSLSDPAVAEMVAPDAEFVMLDTEHAPNSTATIANQIRAIEAADGDAVPFVRALDNDTGAIKRLLDIGAHGVMVPMVESADEAREAVAAARYPPEGNRGVAGTRASAYGRDLGEYVATANDDLTLVVQIETQTGLNRVEEIAAVDGVDALFVGPADLSANLDVFGQFESDVFREAVERILDAGERAATPVGTLATTPAGVDRYCEWGFDYLIAGTDAGHIRRGVSQMGERARQNTE